MKKLAICSLMTAFALQQAMPILAQGQVLQPNTTQEANVSDKAPEVTEEAPEATEEAPSEDQERRKMEAGPAQYSEFKVPMPERNARIGGSGIYYASEIVSRTTVKRDAFLSWHPDFSRYNRVSSYWFSSQNNGSLSVSLSVAYKLVSVSVGYAGSGSGSVISANEAIWTRPAIYGDVIEYKVKVGYKDQWGRWTGTPQNQTYYHSDWTRNVAVPL